MTQKDDTKTTIPVGEWPQYRVGKRYRVDNGSMAISVHRTTNAVVLTLNSLDADGNENGATDSFVIPNWAREILNDCQALTLAVSYDVANGIVRRKGEIDD